MEKITFLFDARLHLWQVRCLEELNLTFSKKVYWWIVDTIHPIFYYVDINHFVNEIKNGAFVVVDHSQDPAINRTLEKLYLTDLFSIFEEYNLNTNQIIVISPSPLNLYLTSSQTFPYKYTSYNSLFEISKKVIKMLNFKFSDTKKSPTKHFTCLMRRDSLNRRFTNYLLHTKNLYSKGLISHLRVSEGNKVTPSSVREEMMLLQNYSFFNVKEYLSYALKKAEIENIQDFLDSKGEATHSYYKHKKYTDHTLFELVSETDTTDVLFSTEKTFKAFISKMPFIVLGNSGILEHLRSLGFKTFSPYIDESYDLIDDPFLRINTALDEVKRLSSMSLKDCENHLTPLKDICEHNFNHYFNTVWHFDIQQKIENLLCEN